MAGSVSPALSWPALNSGFEPRYIARSAMMSAPAVTVNSADSSAEASGVVPLKSSTFAQMLKRLLGGSWYDLVCTAPVPSR